jgi:hypothetical protein
MNAASDREAVAKIVYGAMWPGNEPAVRWERIENVMAKAPILEAADQILALPSSREQRLVEALREIAAHVKLTEGDWKDAPHMRLLALVRATSSIASTALAELGEQDRGAS